MLKFTSLVPASTVSIIANADFSGVEFGFSMNVHFGHTYNDCEHLKNERPKTVKTVKTLHITDI